jgi:hypothetical protein
MQRGPLDTTFASEKWSKKLIVFDFRFLRENALLSPAVNIKIAIIEQMTKRKRIVRNMASVPKPSLSCGFCCLSLIARSLSGFWKNVVLSVSATSEFVST